MEVIPYGYDVPPEMRNEHDGDSPGFLAALSESAVDIEQDSPGLLATLAMTASSSSGGPSTSRAPGHDGASSSHAPRHDGASSSRAASSTAVLKIEDDSDDDS